MNISVCLFSFQTIEKLLVLLGTLDRWIDETPPEDQPSRFGNKAYRTWYAKLDQVNTHTQRVYTIQKCFNKIDRIEIVCM